MSDCTRQMRYRGGQREEEVQEKLGLRLRLKEFIGRSSKDSRVSGRLEYLAGYCGESPTKSGSH